MGALTDAKKKAEAMTLNLMKVVYPSQSQIERMEELDDNFDCLELASQYGDMILKGVYDALMQYYPIDVYCEDLRNYLNENFAKYKECQCAGAAAGAGNISSFAPENCAGVVDIHAKEEKSLKETKYVVAQNCDGEFGYLDDFSELTSDIERAAKYDSREEAEGWAEEGNSYLEEFGYDGETWVEELNESKCMPRKYLNESRALPGGNLESKEKTDYENTLAEHNKNRKEKNAIEGNMQEKLKGPDCGANGIHDWDGSLKESYNFDNIYNNYSKIEG